MQKLTKLFLTLFGIILGLFTLLANNNDQPANELPPVSIKLTECRQLYEDLHLNKEVDYQAFYQAMKGYNKLKMDNSILTLIDFSKPSTENRFFVIDLENREVLFKSLVSHGKRSGDVYATSFSNKVGSKQSSLGFFLTEETYNGDNGLSLILDGLEAGINDNAKAREVVIHGANYCSWEAAQSGRLGRSWGCPALPKEVTESIIETIKGGSLVYAYSSKFNKEYLRKSRII
ncbi:MAG: murein L,D-transpeptidase catalytic domain family protein [Dysgonamonadaceae bacterium]|jgi:hypothetical protein|nr:murein L,D-transpeptidase catalytic domain family protein [Dysgonamonadaceae bacterium]